MGMSVTEHYSAAMVRALPEDGRRYETIHGHLLVTPAPRGRHQVALRALFLRLGSYLNRIGHEEDLLSSPADISFGPDTLVQPDLFVADTKLFLQTDDWADITTLHLVVEVLSDSTAERDRGEKRQLYQAMNIPEYWIVDLEERLVEGWTPRANRPRVERQHLIWRHPKAESDCLINLAEVFGPAGSE